jgi:uncharacterized protein YjbI with pentapeptide repeats
MEANLTDADLRGADLRGADIDYACFKFWCGFLRLKIDRCIAAQLAYHFCSMNCDDPDFIRGREALLSLANEFHRIPECASLVSLAPYDLAMNREQEAAT